MQTGRMELIKDHKGSTVGVHFPDVKFGNSEKETELIMKSNKDNSL
jgi:hypothetical protein